MGKRNESPLHTDLSCGFWQEPFEAVHCPEVWLIHSAEPHLPCVQDDFPEQIYRCNAEIEENRSDVIQRNSHIFLVIWMTVGKPWPPSAH